MGRVLQEAPDQMESFVVGYMGGWLVPSGLPVHILNEQSQSSELAPVHRMRGSGSHMREICLHDSRRDSRADTNSRNGHL